MATTTIEQIALSLQLDGVEYNCQVIDADLTMNGTGTGDTTEVACPEGKVNEVGSHEDGALTGTVYTDTSEAGITWALMQAKASGAEMTYSLTWFADQDATVAFTYSGTCKVGRFSIGWTKPGYSRHPLDLVLTSGTLGRPAAA